MDITYKDHIVAFIDVLGFSALVNSGTTDKLQEYFEYVLDEFSEDRKSYKFDYILISDAIVIYADSKKANFESLCRAISKLQMKLIMRGIIMRGGISFGTLYLNKEKSVIVGSALINAYKLEQEAIYPRVTIDRGFIRLFYKNSQNMLQRNKGNILLDPPAPYQADLPYIYFTRKLALVMQKSKLDSVVELLEHNLSQNKNAQKYLWLKNHIEKALDDQLQYLDEKPSKNKRDERRIRILEEFKEKVEVI